MISTILGRTDTLVYSYSCFHSNYFMPATLMARMLPEVLLTKVGKYGTFVCFPMNLNYLLTQCLYMSWIIEERWLTQITHWIASLEASSLHLTFPITLHLTYFWPTKNISWLIWFCLVSNRSELTKSHLIKLCICPHKFTPHMHFTISIWQVKVPRSGIA
jgi:hypothetical protein